MLRLRDSVRRTDSPLVRVIECFPHHWGQIRRLADIDRQFHELCCDYTEVVELYHYWRERDEAKEDKRVRNYAAILAELEAEILREITASDRSRIQR